MRSVAHGRGPASFVLLTTLLFLLLLPPSVRGETVAIYWYLCGSDLETAYGCATKDVEELLKVKNLPDNVRVVIQTGGAKNWKRYGIKSNRISRYVYHRGRLEQDMELAQASMGKESTLRSFLQYCKDRHDADRRIFIFWDHGNGSVAGLCNDENFGGALSLADVRKAFTSVWPADGNRPPFDIIGFDCCLMGSIDTALAVHGLARYMVGSEDLEPGCGWNYTGLARSVASNPSIASLDLARAMCDTYLRGCRDAGEADEVTLSVVDLSKINDLRLVYNALAMEAFLGDAATDRSYTEYGRMAWKSEKYANSKSEGVFSNMVDMGDLYRKMAGKGLEMPALFLEALREAVPYQVHGSKRHPSGLSCFHPFDGRKASCKRMIDLGRAIGPDLKGTTAFTILHALEHDVIGANQARAMLQQLADEIDRHLEDDDRPQASPSERPVAQQPRPSGPAPGPSSSGTGFSGLFAGNGADPSGSGGSPSQPGASSSSSQNPSGFAFSGLFAGNDAGPSASGGSSSQSGPSSPGHRPVGSGGLFSGFFSGGNAGQPGAGSSSSPHPAPPRPQSGPSSGFGALFSGVFSALDTEQRSFFSGLISTATAAIPHVKPLPEGDLSALDDCEPELVDNVGARLRIDPKKLDMVDSVRLYLCYYDEGDDVIMNMGTNADIEIDWKNGVFSDKFENNWATLEGEVIYLESLERTERHVRYAVPVKVNGVRCNLQVIKNLSTGRFEILGASRQLEGGAVDRSVIRLKPGDKVIPILKVMTISGDDEDFQEVDSDVVTLGKHFKIEEEDMGDAKYVLFFEFSDVRGNVAHSKNVLVTVKGDQMTYELDEN